MRVSECQGETLRYVSVEPDGYSSRRRYPMVVLLHGYGAHMGDLARLCPAIDPQGILYICPNAPIPFRIGPGTVGYAWTPSGGGDPEDARRAEEMLATLVEEVMARYGVEPGQVVLGGFSQGGMMTYRYGLPNAHIFRGLVALSAKLSHPDSLRERLPPERSQSIFVAHGTADTMIPVQDARESRRFLEGEGYRPDYREYSMGHEITQEVLSDMASWIRDLLSSGGERQEGQV